MNDYDIIIIGTGAGEGALAQRLAPGGKRILILERGTFLPQEKENWINVVDGSFFPSCGAVNPSLTIIANALRVGDHLLERLK